MKALVIPLHTLAWLVALLPLLTTHVSYLIAASLEHLPWCMPYWDSCTSISAAGRQLPEKLWFKLGMMPAILLTMLLWYLAWLWCRQAGATRHQRSLAWMPVFGILAGVFLMLYTVALGEEGQAYQRLRRIGVTLAFAFTFLAQLLLTRLVGEMARKPGKALLGKAHRSMLIMIGVLLITGITSVILDGIMGPAYDNIEDAFEWSLALLLNGYFALLALLWQRLKPKLVLQIHI